MNMINGELKYWINGLFSGSVCVGNQFITKSFIAAFGIGNREN